jgi:hypothetical protein
MAQTLTASQPALTAVEVDRIVGYVEQCRTSDGGYFFARVPPASARDTYHTLEALHLLGRRPREAEPVVAWVREAAANGLASQVYGLFYLTKAAVRLGMETAALRERAQTTALPVLTNHRVPVSVYVEVPSELEGTCMALEVCVELGLGVDRARIADRVMRLRNRDGGFGVGGRSTLASTYFAVLTLARARVEGWPAEETVAWLKALEASWTVQFLEQLFWLSDALRALGSSIERRDEATKFVLACQRPNGGFGRASVGIATLEATHRALAVLKEVGAPP